MGEKTTAIEACCSYAQPDQSFQQRLEVHLSLLKHQGRITLWYDRLILAGKNRVEEIDLHLENATLILLLISADFFQSDFCYQVAMQRALERHRRGSARVIPLLLRSVDWYTTPLVHLSVLPTDAQPITHWPDPEDAFADVAAGYAPCA